MSGGTDIGIRIDELPPTSNPTPTHELPAMKDGITVKLTASQIGDVFAGQGRFLPLIGGTLTGSLTVNYNDSKIFLNKANTYESGIVWLTAGQNRWKLISDSSSETGGNVGSDLQISGYLDNGTEVMAMKVQREGGSLELYKDASLIGGNPALNIVKSSTTSGFATMWGYSGGQAIANRRWGVCVGDQRAESGVSAGCDFGIIRCDNTGTFIDNPLTITRDTGEVSITRFLRVSGYDPQIRMQTEAPGQPGGGNIIYGERNTGTLWALKLGDPSANSLFHVTAYDNTSTRIGEAITANRSTPPEVGLSKTRMQYAGQSTGIDYGQSLYFSSSTMPDVYLQAYNQPGVKTALSLLITGAVIGTWSGTGDFTIANKGYQPGGGSWAATSDARVKTVLGDYTSGLDAILGLRPVRYSYIGNDTIAPPSAVDPGLEAETEMLREKVRAAREAGVTGRVGDEEDRIEERITEQEGEPTVPYKNSPHRTVAEAGTEFIGLVAQEAETVMPELVFQRDGYIDGQPVTDLRDMDTGPLVYALIGAVKELTARIQALEGGKSGG